MTKNIFRLWMLACGRSSLRSVKRASSFGTCLIAALALPMVLGLTSCYFNIDNPIANNSLSEKILGKWILQETDGVPVTTDMKSVYTFVKEGSTTKGFYSMFRMASDDWSSSQEIKVTVVSDNAITLETELANGVSVVVQLTDVTVNSNALRFTAMTTLSKDGLVTNTYGPSREYFTKVDDDYSDVIVGRWEGIITSNDPEFTTEEFCEEYYADGTFCEFTFTDGQWVKDEAEYADYFVDGTLFSTRLKYVGEEQPEGQFNFVIKSYEDGILSSEAVYRRDGKVYTYTSRAIRVDDSYTTPSDIAGQWVADYAEKDVIYNTAYNRLVEEYSFRTNGTGYYEAFMLNGATLVGIEFMENGTTPHNTGFGQNGNFKYTIKGHDVCVMTDEGDVQWKVKYTNGRLYDLFDPDDIIVLQPATTAQREQIALWRASWK